MRGLEMAYYELDNVRRRLVRLVEMGRLDADSGYRLIGKVLALRSEVGDLIEEEESEDDAQV